MNKIELTKEEALLTIRLIHFFKNNVKPKDEHYKPDIEFAKKLKQNLFEQFMQIEAQEAEDEQHV